MYEIYALKVAERETESPRMFLHTDYGKNVLLVYYLFCLKGNNHTILMDTGISAEELAKRGIVAEDKREEMLGRIDVRPGDVDTIVLTHLHDDHFAGPEIYPNATFYVQKREVEYWCGEVQGFKAVSSPPSMQGKPMVDILTFQKLNMQGRVRFLDGDSQIYPGLSTLHWGAHTPGHQLITVQTGRGLVLLCADFCDFYRNLEERIPIGLITNLEEWFRGMSSIERMALPEESVIPGHDSLLLTKFTAVAEDVVKIA
jgi:glyoxylase-like metal-dependent hydrolase (beta-lactamase superfamily II)